MFRLALGSPIAHGASRLALHATAPCAAAGTVCRPKYPSIQLLPSRRDGVKGGEHFAHDRAAVKIGELALEILAIFLPCDAVHSGGRIPL